MAYLGLGTQGATGVSTGPHFHFEVFKDGKRFPITGARKDLGQYLEVLTPGAKNWSPVFSSEQTGFQLNPAGTITSPMGRRAAPTAGASTDHGGVDIAFTPGTQLRFRGEGSVATHQGRGAAGNVASLRTGPYELNVFHLDQLPTAATTRVSDTQVLDTATIPSADTRTQDILKAFLYGAQTAGAKKEKTLEEQLKEQIMGSVISQALTPSNFLSSYNLDNSYMKGFNTGTQDFFGGIYG